MTKEERSWILYDVANSAYSIMVTAAIFPVFFKTFAARDIPGYTSTAWLGYGNSIYTLAIAFLAPILGTIADIKNYKKRFFFCFFALGVISTLVFPIVQQGQWIVALAIYLASAIGFAGANIFYDSFLTDITSTERMDFISTTGFACGYIGGSTVPFVLAILLIANYRFFGLNSSIQAVRIAFVLTALWWAAFAIPFLKNVKQLYYLERPDNPIRASFERLVQTFKDIKSYRSAFTFLVAYFFYIDGVDTIIKMATAFGTDMGIAFDSLLVILLAVQIVAFPFALLYGRLASITSTRFMLLVGICIYILITFLAYFLNFVPAGRPRIIFFWVLSMLVASSQGGIQALSRSYYGKLIPRDRSAEFFGFYNIFGKFATIVGPLLIAVTSQITKNTGAGVLSLLLLFLIGGGILTRIKAPSK
jgi:UMF1 family MFS transporter